jgi:hypothetical protein
MPSPDATMIAVELYVEPEYVDAIRRAFNKPDDNSLLLDIERLCGLHIAVDNATLSEFRHRVSRRVDYGQNVVEVYLEGMS